MKRGGGEGGGGGREGGEGGGEMCKLSLFLHWGVGIYS